MTRKKILQIPFVFFLLPYIHFSLAIDYLFDSIIGIFLFLLLTISMGFYAKITQQLSLLILGNIINILLSWGLIFFKSPLVNMYHSSSPFITAFFLILLFIISQLTGVFWGSFFQKEFFSH